VVSDGERILGLGDQGAGGMGIPSARWPSTPLWAASRRALPAILLDVAPTMKPISTTPSTSAGRTSAFAPAVRRVHRGVCHRRQAPLAEYSLAMGGLRRRQCGHPAQALPRQICTFNDDIQEQPPSPPARCWPRPRHRPSAQGANHSDVRVRSAGIGIGDLLIAAMKEEGLSEEQARGRIYCFNRYGLLSRDARHSPGQETLLRKRADVAGGSWLIRRPAPAPFLCSMWCATQGSRCWWASPRRPARLRRRSFARWPGIRAPDYFSALEPHLEGRATPADLLRWSEGRALVGTGSPFSPVEVNGKLVRISQVNNSFIFPACAGHSRLAVYAGFLTR